TVFVAFSSPGTGSPSTRAAMSVIFPFSALTVIPRSGRVSILPPAGVIDSRAALGSGPPERGPVRAEQPVTAGRTAAQTATCRSRRRRRCGDRDEVASAVAIGCKSPSGIESPLSVKAYDSANPGGHIDDPPVWALAGQGTMS